MCLYCAWEEVHQAIADSANRTTASNGLATELCSLLKTAHKNPGTSLAWILHWLKATIIIIIVSGRD